MSYTVSSFFAKLKPYVIKDMYDTTIPSSLTAAQAFIESKYGNSGLAVNANNLFGIKGSYNGQSVSMMTTEYYNGVACKVRANFRKYPSWQESISDHSGLFLRSARYANLRGETDYVKACKNVQADGYATSPTYANTLINTINKYKLYEWDQEVLGKTIKPKAEIKTPVLKRGSKGEHVLAWQKFLNQNGYSAGLEDGKFGICTELAVKSWQAAHPECGKPDGIIGPKTWASIGILA